MSSSPLFMRVALSTDILRPMFHFGWAQAWAGVAAAIASGLAVRNGPPDAVSVSFSTRFGWVST